MSPVISLLFLFVLIFPPCMPACLYLSLLVKSPGMLHLFILVPTYLYPFFPHLLACVPFVYKSLCLFVLTSPLYICCTQIHPCPLPAPVYISWLSFNLPALFLTYAVSLLASSTCLCYFPCFSHYPACFISPLHFVPTCSVTCFCYCSAPSVLQLSCLVVLLVFIFSLAFASSLTCRIFFSPACFSSPCLNNPFTPSFICHFPVCLCLVLLPFFPDLPCYLTYAYSSVQNSASLTCCLLLNVICHHLLYYPHF